MRRWSNTIGNVNHTACYPETPSDEALIADLERSLPCIDGNKIDTIPDSDPTIYQLAAAHMTHERDEGILHLYSR